MKRAGAGTLRAPLVLAVLAVLAALTMLVGLALLVTGAAAGLHAPWPGAPRTPPWTPAVQAARAQQAFPCAELDSQHPYLVLVLGQSNAGNHADAAPPAAPIALLQAGRCYRTNDPLPGASGNGSSLWPRVAAQLGGHHGEAPLAFAVIALDASSIADWTGPGALHDYVALQLRALGASGRKVGLVLWQQGEADARDRTSAAGYGAGLAALRALLDDAAIRAPLMIARSTYCPGTDGSAVRAAIAAYLERDARALAGPDTDSLQGAALRHGCHFTAQGLDAAAALWAARLRTAP